MSTLLHDLRFALRLLFKSPGFTLIAIATLAVAIGVNTAVFSIVNGLLLKPLAWEDPEQVVSVFSVRKEASRDYRQFSHAEYALLRESKEVFADVAAVKFALAGIGRETGEMRRSFIFLATDNFFSLMGARPAAGRFFTAEESQPNANLPVVVASHSLWQRMGGRPDFVGSTLRVNDRPHTVVGVAPKGFSGISSLLAPEIWLPLGQFVEIAGPFGGTEIRDLNHPRNYTFNLMARLQPGLNLESAKSRLPVIEEHLTAMQPPETPGTRGLHLTVPSRFSVSTTPSDDGPVSLLATLLLAMAGVVLLIASLNLANMLLARGTNRAREMAVRLAVGASRWQLIRQLLIEGLLLAVLGGAAGLLLSIWSNSILETSFTSLLSSMNFTLASGLQPDGRVVAVTFLLCLVATVAFSLGPALKAARTDVVTDLKSQGSESTATGRFNRFFAPRHLLVMAQMTLSLVLLFSAGLFLRGALKAGALALGYEPQGALLAELDYSLTNTPRADALNRMDALRQRMRTLPGVQATGLSSLVPYGNLTNMSRIMPANQPMPDTADPKAPRPGASGIHSSISPGYLDTLGVRLLRGRDFTEVEFRDQDAPGVCIVDEGLAQALFPDTDALGQRVRYTQPRAEGPNEMEIVGIVSRHRHDVTDNPDGTYGPARRLYVPLAQYYSASVFLAVRYGSTDRDKLLASLPSFRQALRDADPALPLLQLLPMSDMIDRSITLWIVRLGAVLFGVFGAIALLLAVVGVYGVKAYAVGRRTREIGIRMALGADRGDVFRLIMGQGALQTVVAVGLGIGLSLLVGQVLASVLFQVSPMDPLALGTSAFLLAVTTLLACYLPARRATRVSPTTALRAE